MVAEMEEQLVVEQILGVDGLSRATSWTVWTPADESTAARHARRGPVRSCLIASPSHRSGRQPTACKLGLAQASDKLPQVRIV